MAVSLDNLHWKDVALGAILIIQALIGIIWVDIAGDVKQHEIRIDTLEVFKGETAASRFTASDAADMQLIFLRELQNIRSGLSTDIASLRQCINQNVVEGRKVACN